MKGDAATKPPTTREGRGSRNARLKNHTPPRYPAPIVRAERLGLIVAAHSCLVEPGKRNRMMPAASQSATFSTPRLRPATPIRIEVLAGARDDGHLQDLRGLLARATLLPTEPIDYEQAAAIYRVCRRSGETVRKLIDCLITAVAIREGVPLLESDADFKAIARQTTLS